MSRILKSLDAVAEFFSRPISSPSSPPEVESVKAPPPSANTPSSRPTTPVPSDYFLERTPLSQRITIPCPPPFDLIQQATPELELDELCNPDSWEGRATESGRFQTMLPPPPSGVQ